MQSTSTVVVVLSSLLVAATAVAGPNDQKKAPPPTPAPAPPSDAPAPDAGSGSAEAPAPADVKPEDMPTAVRMRRIEQKTQELKERAWQLKARSEILKENMLGGGVGAQALITHKSEMGSAYRLIKLTYSLDGTEVFGRNDDTAESLYKTKSFDVFGGPIAPGNHSVSAVATYRGHGYGLFEYMSKYTFTAKGSNQFVAGEGKTARVECRGFEKGGMTTKMENRTAIDCKVTQVMPEKPNATPTPTTPGTTPLPAASAGQ